MVNNFALADVSVFSSSSPVLKSASPRSNCVLTFLPSNPDPFSSSAFRSTSSKLSPLLSSISFPFASFSAADVGVTFFDPPKVLLLVNAPKPSCLLPVDDEVVEEGEGLQGTGVDVTFSFSFSDEEDVLAGDSLGEPLGEPTEPKALGLMPPPGESVVVPLPDLPASQLGPATLEAVLKGDDDLENEENVGCVLPAPTGELGFAFDVFEARKLFSSGLEALAVKAEGLDENDEKEGCVLFVCVVLSSGGDD